jgi:preprotein translocase subunit SecB
MKAKFSPLQLLDFNLMRTEYEFVAPDSSDINLKELFSKYPVEIDFAISKGDDLNEIQLFTIIEVNFEPENEQVGYKIIVEGGATFRITDAENLDEGIKTNLLQFSTLNIMINNLRNVMYQLTNLGPMGGYILPPIDITKLLMDKLDQQEDN